MKLKLNLQILCVVVISALLVNAVDIHINPASNRVSLNIGKEALAKRGGGRASGGSFSRSSPSRLSSPSRSSSSDSNYRGNSGYSSGTNVYIAPSGGYGYSYGYYDSSLSMFVLVLVLAIIAIAIVAAIKNSTNNAKNSSTDSSDRVSGNKELDNNIVTVSKIQVALLAQARSIQKQLTEYTLNANTETSEGLSELLQESVLALLRSPENWTHVSATSKTVRTREEAETIFKQLSIEERTKFSGETLTNVNGKVRQTQQDSPPESEPGRYIVVTLLIGSENDRPLFANVFSIQELKQALERIAAVPQEYLTAFELLWTPQSDTESLTYDEMLTEYANMMQIA